MLLAPARWLVQLTAWLPEVVRPGVFVGLILFALWFAFVQRGLPNLWHALCRGTARIVDIVVGLLLLPEYLLTTARQKQSQPPAQAALAFGGVAERVLDEAGGLYQRHQREPMRWKRVPWLPLGVVVAVISVPWAVMELAPPTSPVTQGLSQAYDVWRDLENWADVDPSRRAEPGVTWPPRPRVLSSRRHGRTMGVTLRCRNDEQCKGRLILRNGKGVRLDSRLVAVGPGRTATVHVKLSREDARSNHVSARIARAEPE
jgi:hypothetical protein